jgi:nitroimidazol reductase NimA-like FMN-containing flavoprotein (pyridoxamine 5'-phosphate oxidase superfamily)
MSLRRSEREIVDRETIDSIIARSKVCRLGLIVDGRPYVIPLSFGYDGTAVFFHTAMAGKKVAGLQERNQVCIEFDIPGDLVTSPEACRWSMAYESVIAYGTVEVLESVAEKRSALMTIMRHYAEDARDWSFPASVVDKTLVLRVPLHEVTGKASPAKKSTNKHMPPGTDAPADA